MPMMAITTSSSISVKPRRLNNLRRNIEPPFLEKDKKNDHREFPAPLAGIPWYPKNQEFAVGNAALPLHDDWLALGNSHDARGESDAVPPADDCEAHETGQTTE